MATRFITYGVNVDPISKQYMEAVLSLPALQAWTADAKKEKEVISV